MITAPPFLFRRQYPRQLRLAAVLIATTVVAACEASGTAPQVTAIPSGTTPAPAASSPLAPFTSSPRFVDPIPLPDPLRSPVHDPRETVKVGIVEIRYDGLTQQAGQLVVAFSYSGQLTDPPSVFLMPGGIRLRVTLEGKSTFHSQPFMLPNGVAFNEAQLVALVDGELVVWWLVGDQGGVSGAGPPAAARPHVLATAGCLGHAA